jgi:hypothetical protein
MNNNVYYNEEYNDSVKRKFSDETFDKKCNFVSYKWCTNCLDSLMQLKCPNCNKICHGCNKNCGSIFCQNCKTVILRKRCSICNKSLDELIYFKNNDNICINCKKHHL